MGQERRASPPWSSLLPTLRGHRIRGNYKQPGRSNFPNNNTAVADIVPRMRVGKTEGKQTVSSSLCQPLAFTFLPDIKLENVTRYKEIQISKKTWGRNQSMLVGREAGRRKGGNELCCQVISHPLMFLRMLHFFCLASLTSQIPIKHMIQLNCYLTRPGSLIRSRHLKRTLAWD